MARGLFENCLPFWYLLFLRVEFQWVNVCVAFETQNECYGSIYLFFGASNEIKTLSKILGISADELGFNSTGAYTPSKTENKTEDKRGKAKASFIIKFMLLS